MKTKDDLQQLMDETPIWKPPIEDPAIVELDDLNADTIARAYEDASKYKHHYHLHDGWTMFKDRQYQKVDGKEQVSVYISRFACRCVVRKKKSLERFAVTDNKVKNILTQVAYLPNVGLLPNQAAPCSLDGMLNPETTIAANNSLISVKEYPYTIHELTDQYYTVNYLDYDYIQNAFSELWERFLIDVTVGDLDLMVTLQQWAGYLLLPTLRYQKFLLCVGDGANGKGVFSDTLAGALGKRNVSNVPLARFADKHTMFGTYGKLANMSNENTKDLESNAESIIKEYVAGDKMLWEQKYKDPFFAYLSDFSVSVRSCPLICNSTYPFLG